MTPSTTRGVEFYARAKNRIPGGTQLLSKRPEMFLPDQWPSYYAKAKGCEVWDLDGRKFVDMTTNGIGACLLGFADDDVNAAVKQCIDDGNMCTLNSPAEVELAELLCELHPWADSVRYARGGGEAMAVAVRIARAATGREKVAFCGYHGWCDWYLAANLETETSLDGHLLPGLQPVGVPRGLQGTMLPFHYNHIEQLNEHVKQHDRTIGAIVLETIRSDRPADGFLQKVRALADSIGAVLILDEITCGWREQIGGAHLSLGIEPDIAVFAKAISNGFPMGAIIGRRSVMQAAQTSFISSTYWTESIGPTAALATIRKMREVDLPKHLVQSGKQVQAGWREWANKHAVDITVSGGYPLGHFTLNYGPKSQALRTLLTQLMLERGFLATDSYYATYAHTAQVINAYLAALDEVFVILKQAVDADDVHSRLQGPVAHSGFRRLT
jgi:glutamate-1-semialdehyde 2,1-aminomutase